MADTCVAYTFAGITINATSGDCLFTDFESGQITGLDGAPIRRQIDPAGQAEGGIIFPGLFGPRAVTFQGKILIRSQPAANREDYAAAVMSVEAASITALEGALNSPGALAWTPSGGSAKSITCYYGVEGGELQFSGNMIDRSFTFTLIAADPTIS